MLSKHPALENKNDMLEYEKNERFYFMSIQAVIFDLDNTLTHRDLSTQAYSQYLLDFYTHQLIDAVVEQIYRIVCRIDNGGYPIKELLTHKSIGASVAYALLQELKWQNPPSLDELSDFWFSQFGNCAVAMPHLVEVLKHLKSKNYKLAVISNGGHETRMNIIQGLGIEHYFDEIISSGAFGKSKPHAEIFLHAAAKLNVEADQCLYIGDHPVNDVQGAKNAGMHALWMQGFHSELGEIEHKIQNLSQLIEHLNYLNNILSS